MTIPNTNSCGHPFPQRPQPVRANRAACSNSPMTQQAARTLSQRRNSLPVRVLTNPARARWEAARTIKGGSHG